jgi:hypothetical protein
MSMLFSLLFLLGISLTHSLTHSQPKHGSDGDPNTLTHSLTHDTTDYVRRISDPDLYYAAESRNYPEAPDTLFVTMRGGGVKVFDISEEAELKVVAQWVSECAVEGQDRIGDLMVVAELGRG